jgi:hypothetical protein
MIKVPIKGESSKFVEVHQEKLPQDEGQEITSLLQKEQASVEYWLEIAVRKSIDLFNSFETNGRVSRLVDVLQKR